MYFPASNFNFSWTSGKSVMKLIEHVVRASLRIQHCLTTVDHLHFENLVGSQFCILSPAQHWCCSRNFICLWLIKVHDCKKTNKQKKTTHTDRQIGNMKELISLHMVQASCASGHHLLLLRFRACSTSTVWEPNSFVFSAFP